MFAIPAIYTIDTFGRRNLLLTTFPLMSLFLFFTGFSFFIPEATMHTARIACVALGIYLFGMVYSPGEGPVPLYVETFPCLSRNLLKHSIVHIPRRRTRYISELSECRWPQLRRGFLISCYPSLGLLCKPPSPRRERLPSTPPGISSAGYLYCYLCRRRRERLSRNWIKCSVSSAARSHVRW